MDELDNIPSTSVDTKFVTLLKKAVKFVISPIIFSSFTGKWAYVFTCAFSYSVQVLHLTFYNKSIHAAVYWSCLHTILSWSAVPQWPLHLINSCMVLKVNWLNNNQTYFKPLWQQAARAVWLSHGHKNITLYCCLIYLYAENCISRTQQTRILSRFPENFIINTLLQLLCTRIRPLNFNEMHPGMLTTTTENNTPVLLHVQCNHFKNKSTTCNKS